MPLSESGKSFRRESRGSGGGPLGAEGVGNGDGVADGVGDADRAAMQVVTVGPDEESDASAHPDVIGIDAPAPEHVADPEK